MNIIEIAKLAGVSKSTVSRYLNNGYVSDESREKIKKVIEETGFLPQRHAKSMRTKKTNLVGVIVPKISTETAPRVVEGITEILSPHNYDVLIANTNLSIEKEIEYLKIFKSNQVDGIIFMATKITDKHLEVMREVKVPIVVVAQKVNEYPSVYHDDYNASKEIVGELLYKGHRNIGFIGVYEEDISVGYERKRGYIDKLKETSIEIIEDNIKIGDFSEKSGFKLTRELMNRKDKPTAIFTATDNIAFGAVQYLLQNNYRIPEDVAIISIGDSKISRVITPKLTTMHYYYKTSGRKSAEMMLDLLNKGVTSSKNIEKNLKLTYRLEKRDSV
ncbi:LacI family DNA-binding transcriptional regulator [Clostridium chauvoei]|uniref:Putative sucrose operon repressor n=2 Tax=Clostridium chauvoei TaxID=46867 RepID=A0A1U6JJ49_9CLOT|nr:LacI family DNA-binding transcriptional regulator [Clostridium chauvoei]ATD55534.1 LacI family transcriptional regulator [Clostridium chauvoei]ATD56790.1 LacI family transcriptional regulator [Clostridium chauvoei]QBJ75829.1 LacI family transcriptional regulator [Clostridium chauvoei]SLK20346.1 Putative sucrose operon repressor [Clostridium chauvoei JF4335]